MVYAQFLFRVVNCSIWLYDDVHKYWQLIWNCGTNLDYFV